MTMFSLIPPAVGGHVRRRWWVTAVAALACLLTTPLPAQQMQRSPELRYAVVPTATRVFWDNDLGLEDTYLYGGRLGFTFGKYIGLQGYYLTGDEFDTRFRDTPLRRPDGSLLPEQRMDIRTYGADVLVNVGNRGLFPFLKAGAGVIRFEPNEGRRSDQIMVKYGAGLRFALPGQLRLQAFAEDQLFRINRFQLTEGSAGDPLPADDDADKLRHNLVVGAGITIPFGASATMADRPEYGLSKVGLPFEIMAGRVQFDGSTNLERQTFIGARTGIDFGHLVGLRGYYWRGITNGFDKTLPIQSWGGEAQFNLSPSSNLSPYLLVGAGELDFQSSYRNQLGQPVEDRTMLIAGGGIRLGITDGVRLDIAARDYIISEDTDIQDASSTKQLKSNWTYSAGLSFTLFGPRGQRSATPRPTPVRVERADVVVVDPTTVALGDTVRMLRDSLARSEALAQRDRARADSLANVRRGVAMESRPAVTSQATPPAASTTYVSGRSVAVPVPQEGEIYIRYGPPAEGAAGQPAVTEVYQAPLGASPAAMRSAIRDLVRDELERDQRAMPPAAQARPRAARPDTMAMQRGEPTEMQVAQMERRIVDLLDRRFAEQSAQQREMMRTLIREEMAAQRTDSRAIAEEVDRAVDARLGPGGVVQQPAEPPRVVVRQDTVRADSANVTTVTTVTTEGGTTLVPAARSIYGYGGFGATGGTQAIIGARVDLGSISRNFAAVKLVPEIALGFGDGATTSLFAANGQLHIARVRQVAPYVSLGLGLLNHTGPIEGREGVDFVVNPGVGALMTFPSARNTLGLGSGGLFVEYQGVAMFDVSRLLAGLRWSF